MTASAQANDSAARETELFAVLVLYYEFSYQAKGTVIVHNNFYLITHPGFPLLFPESA